jgi:hypothetical protein
MPERWPTSETRPELREIAAVPEAQLEDFGSGLTPVTQGWFVVNVRDAEWWFSESRGARCAFENEYGDPPVEFAQFGINVTVLGRDLITIRALALVENWLSSPARSVGARPA